MVADPDTFPFILVGNKVDLQDDKRQVSYNNGQKFAKENGGMIFIETSASSNLNIEEAFKLLAE